MSKIKLPLAILSIIITSLFTILAIADHAWGKYHWDISTLESEADPLDLGDNTSTLA